MEGLEFRGTKPNKPSDCGIVSSAPRGREVLVLYQKRPQRSQYPARARGVALDTTTRRKPLAGAADAGSHGN